jgi:hypothetical protein
MLQLSVQQDFIKVHVMEVGGDKNAFVIYNFGKNLTPMKPIISDHLKDIHATMRSRGELDHDYSESEVDELAKGIIIRNNRK